MITNSGHNNTTLPQFYGVITIPAECNVNPAVRHSHALSYLLFLHINVMAVPQSQQMYSTVPHSLVTTLTHTRIKSVMSAVNIFWCL